ncbi:hypothetical protein H0H92_001956 [Tricholoma furcatifolium]|nr:hypothetical protein H0H92_001956 [Tricholoma furcatifolium]
MFMTYVSYRQYLVTDPSTLKTAVIDPVLDYDPTTRTLSTATADCILNETHAHADHLSASQYYKKKLPGNIPVCIGKRINQVQETFAARYGLDHRSLGNAFDVLFEDDEVFDLGETVCKVIHLPGHTPDHVGYMIGKNVFTGDTLFPPDVGSARADFPGGNAKALYSTIQCLLALPAEYRLFTGHDYPPEGRREPNCMNTVDEQRLANKHGKLGTTEEGFVKLREERDAILGSPRLLHPSLKVNICAGKYPPPNERGETHV